MNEATAKKNITPYQVKVKENLFYLIIKRIFDVAASLFAVVVLSPLLLLVALIIYIDDPQGSPLYTQERVGKDGKIFKFYKFRSMVVNADSMLDQLAAQNEKDGPAFKIKDDPRITRIGKFIRKTSIDELPQLINIIKGDMSVVGPRPALPKEVEQYTEREKSRLLVKPGLTCIWQASRNRDDISFEKWIDLDIEYIENRNFWLDIKLILKTFIVIFTGNGN